MSELFESLRARDERVMCPTYGRYPVAVERAKGARLYDVDGREYVDMLAGIAVVNLGHGRPEPIEAMRRQLEKLTHVSNLFYQEPQVDLAEKLLATTRLDRVFFCNSGAEANEAAVKLARRYFQKVNNLDVFETITLEGAFHGRTLAMLAATGQRKYQDGFYPMPLGFASVAWNDIEALRRRITRQTCAVMVEVVQGEGGVRPMSREYAQGVEAVCRENGLLLIIDEIQTGMCRTGEFWAHEHYGLTPDIVTAAKGLANGPPMGAMMAREEIARALTPGSHATTFGGSPIPAAAAAAVVETMQRENIAASVRDKGEQTMTMLGDVHAEFPGLIREVRGLGLMIGVQMRKGAQETWRGLLDKGYVCNVTADDVVRILPPLTIKMDDLRGFVEAFQKTVKEVGNRL